MSNYFQPDINGQTATTLRDLVGGGTAMQYISEQNDMRRRMNPINEGLSLADLDRVTQANDQSRSINPLEVQIKAAAARDANSKDAKYYQSMRLGDMGKAEKEAADGKLATATVDTNIGATNSANKLKQIQNLGHQVTNMAAYVGSLDPNEVDPHTGRNARQEALTQIIGNDPQLSKSPLLQKLMTLPPAKLQEALTMIGTGLRNTDPALLNAQQIHASDNISSEKIAAGNNAATRYAADANKKEAGEAFKREWIKADDAKKASWLRQLVMHATGPTVDTPLGPISVMAAQKEAQRLEQQVTKNKAAGALVGDERTRQIINMPRSSSGESSEQPARTWNPNTRRWE